MASSLRRAGQVQPFPPGRACIAGDPFQFGSGRQPGTLFLYSNKEEIAAATLAMESVGRGCLGDAGAHVSEMRRVLADPW
jgi:hypothetical protein